MRAEIAVLSVGLSCWVASLVLLLLRRPAAGPFVYGLYAFYAVAATLGTLAGHCYVARRRALPLSIRPLLRIVYVVGPPGLLFLLWALTSPPSRHASPLAPLYAYGVYVVFFLVPATLRRS